MVKRGFRDRDFLRTPEGFLFCVVGSTHPPDRVMAYLKYVPRKGAGPWSKGSITFYRALRDYTMASLRETLVLLRDYPFYLTYFEAFGTEMSAVPVDRIEEHYKPEERLRQIMGSSSPDILEEKVIGLTDLISDLSGVSISRMGVTGSILLGIHVPGISDIDLVVYGLKASLKVKEAVLRAFEDRSVEIEKFTKDMVRSWCVRKSKSHPITLEEAFEILRRKWNMGLYAGTRFSIHPVLTEEEAEEYGSRIYRPVGRAVVRAEVLDATWSIFLPAIYRVRVTSFLEGPRLTDIREVCSYEDLYAGLASEGEEIVVKGKLEMVVDRQRKTTYYRLLVGSLEGGDEFIKPVVK